MCGWCIRRTVARIHENHGLQRIGTHQRSLRTNLRWTGICRAHVKASDGPRAHSWLLTPAAQDAVSALLALLDRASVWSAGGRHPCGVAERTWTGRVPLRRLRRSMSAKRSARAYSTRSTALRVAICSDDPPHLIYWGLGHGGGSGIRRRPHKPWVDVPQIGRPRAAAPAPLDQLRFLPLAAGGVRYRCGGRRGLGSTSRVSSCWGGVAQGDDSLLRR